jgi:alkyl sulfatase BDS1-like metallo-beta-lactamase superfamily hydrolase
LHTSCDRKVAEVTQHVPANTDATIGLPYRTFAMIMTGETTLPNEIEMGIATVTGNLEAVNEVIGSFDKVAKDQTNPGHLHN